MSNWQQPPNPGYYPGQQGYPYPPQPGYPPPGGEFNQGYPPPPAPGFVPPGGYGQGQPPPPTAAPFGGPPPGAGMYGTGYAEDPMHDEIKGFDFSEKTIRNGFIRKVYSILMVQLSITVAMIAWFMYHAPTRRYVQTHPPLFWTAFALTIVLIICMACCTNVRRKAPMNFIFLFVFTLAEAFLLATASSTYDAEAVLMAAGITAAICLALTLFAFQTKYDFTGCHTVLFIALVVLMLFGLIAIFIPGNKIVHLVYASLGALLFSFYLIYDTQMMLGGKHKYSVSPEEYIFAALNLYLDVINIFMYILAIIGSSRD
ncbi:protein lifeguard 1 [Diachasma alloeum]|uniref:protein lifeguard 1 n=1 Tax=Diachasma alloeum TaxID=454923 RepID=UPI0007382FA9|nr:protein lifeguard 1 [Diachasma alloeum]